MSKLYLKVYSDTRKIPVTTGANKEARIEVHYDEKAQEEYILINIEREGNNVGFFLGTCLVGEIITNSAGKKEMRVVGKKAIMI